MKLFQRNSKKNLPVRFAHFGYTCLFILILLINSSAFVMADEQGDMKKSIQIINPRPDFALSLRLDKGAGATYAPGERIRVYFRSTKNAYVTLFGYDARGNVRLLFPNQHQKNQFIEANREYYIDGVIEAGTPTGIEYVQGFATTESVIVTRELERRLADENFPIIEEGISRFTQRIRGILTGLPSQRWVSSEVLHYQVVDRIMETGRLQVTSSPSGADIYLSDRNAGKTPLSMDQVRIGEYVIRVEKPGYQVWSSTIRINPNRTTTMHAGLERIQQHGTVAIRCNEGNARIYLDGQYKGLTERNRNVLLDQVIEGSHDIRITLSGYRDWSQRIEVRPNQRVQLTVNLERIIQRGSIAIRSNENNARIYVDNQYKGTTDKDRNIIIDGITEGFHDIKITLSGYRDWSQRIELRPNQRVQITVDIEKIIQTGSLEITSDADNALIYLDGNYQRRTSSNRSVTISNIQEGIYELRIVKEGYQDYIATVRIYPDQTYRINARMQPVNKKGAIAVYCNESNARIFLNGIYKTTTSANQVKILDELEEGMYEITVIKEGYRVWLEESRVYSGETTSIFADLIEVEN